MSFVEFVTEALQIYPDQSSGLSLRQLSDHLRIAKLLSSLGEFEQPLFAGMQWSYSSGAGSSADQTDEYSVF